jgi:endo-1,3(4)-beta-glucanase
MTRSRPLLALRAVGTSALLALLAGCASSAGAGPTGASSTGPTGNLESALGSVPHRSVAPMPTARLAHDLIPPTNRWFSGLVFGNTPQPVFPLPLSFGLTGTGFGFGVPAITSGADTITGEYTPAVTVDDQSTSAEISAYDAASVTIAQKASDGATIGSVVIAEGSPVVSYTAARSGILTLGQPFTSAGKGLFTTRIAGLDYGLLTSGSVNGAVLHLAKGQTAVRFRRAAAPRGWLPTSRRSLPCRSRMA